MPIGGLYQDPIGEQMGDDPTPAFESVAGAGDFLVSKAVAEEPPEPPFESVTQKIDPKTGKTKTTVTGVNESALKHFTEMVSRGEAASKLYEQVAAQALRKKEVLESNPIIAGIGRIASNAALNYSQSGSRARPLVNAAGAYGAEFFQDTPESLLIKAAQAQEQGFKVQGQIVNQTEDQRRFQIQEDRIASTETLAREQAAARLSQETRGNIIRTRGQYLDRAKNELLVPEQADQIAADLENAGASPEEARNFAGQMIEASRKANFLRLAEEASKDKRTADKLRADREEMFARFAQQDKLADKRADAMVKSMAGGLPTAVARRIDPVSRAFDSLPIVKNVQKQAEAADFAKSLNINTKSPSDDQALIYAFAKAMDPDSAVREGEYDTVQKYAQSWAERFGFNAKRVFSNTQFLTPGARANMKKTILQKYEAGRKQYDNVRSEFGRKINMATGQENGVEYLTDYGAAFPKVSQPATAKPAGPIPDDVLRQIPKNGTPVAVEIGGVERIFRFVNGVVVEVQRP